MAFEAVTWPNKAEVTTTRLNQMTENDQWLKDHMVIGKRIISLGNRGQHPQGRSVGTTDALKIYGLHIPFSNPNTLTTFIDITFSFPTGTFTTTPIMSVSLFNFNADTYAGVFWQNESVNGPFVYRVYRVDQIEWAFNGSLDVIAIGN